MAIMSADLETTTTEDDCRVWAWGVADIEDAYNVEYGNSIETLMERMKNKGGTYYFHNLKFDGNFILYYLLKNGYQWRSNSKSLQFREFSTLISDMGSWYTIKIKFPPNSRGESHSVSIRDSLKCIPLSVSEIPAAFGLPIQKLDLDYNGYREIGHELTPEEKSYLGNDVTIVALALKFMREHKQTKLTSASNALADYKKRIGTKRFNQWFPELDIDCDYDIRKTYKGGWTYLNPKYKNLQIPEGSVFDVNSMYPWAMKHTLLPYGQPLFFQGEYQPDSLYPLYVTHIECCFKIKPGKYPSIQIKGGIFADNEYLTSSYDDKTNQGGLVELWLTSVDYELFLHNYEVTDLKHIDGYKFKARHGMFDVYIDHWYDEKTNSKKIGNKGMERIAKLMLNSLYGKFGSRMTGRSKIPYYDPIADMVRYKIPKTLEDCIKFNLPTPDPRNNPKKLEYGEEARKGGYLPVATFITSYCRDKIIRGAEACGDRFIYADTDSLHIYGTEAPEGLDIDEYRLGAFKLEETFIRAKFIRQKTYLEIYLKKGKEQMNLKCCGMPDKMKKSISEEMFYEGAVFDATINDSISPKLMPKVVPGGVILKETTFKIKSSVNNEGYKVKFNDRVYQLSI